MGREINVWAVIFVIVLTVCFASVNIEKQQQILNEYVTYLNSLPNQLYKYEAIEILKAEKLENIPNAYNVEMKIEATDLHNVDISRYLLCFAMVTTTDATKIVVKSSQCNYVSDESHSTSEQAGLINMQTDPTPVVAENGIEVNTEVTSDQFAAVSKDQPAASCIGCYGRINPWIPDVIDLASLALNQLDSQDPFTKHSLDAIINVNRQIALDASMYILILNVTYDNCSTVPSQFCKNVKICKVSILDNNRTDLANDSKYRNILSNNCTSNTDLPYVNDVGNRITDTKVPFEKTLAFDNSLAQLYLDNDNINNIQLLERNPDEHHVKYLAQKSLTKYLQSVKNTQPHEVLKIENVTTQVSSGLTTRMVFTATASGTQYLKYKLHCQSSVWEQLWINKEHVKVTCDAAHPYLRHKRNIPEDIEYDLHNDNNGFTFAERAMQHYMKKEKITQFKIMQIISHTEISHQVYNLISVNFIAKVSDSQYRICDAIQKEEPIEENKNINIYCTHTKQRFLFKEENPNYPRFKELMDLSLNYYLQTNNIRAKYTVSDRIIATEQFISTEDQSVQIKLVFRARGQKKGRTRLLCRSKIIRQNLRPHKNSTSPPYFVTCVKIGRKHGENVEKNPKDKRYDKLAQISSSRFLYSSTNFSGRYKITKPITVTQQVTSITFSRIDFRLQRIAPLLATDYRCYAEIKSSEKEDYDPDVNCDLVYTSIPYYNSIQGGVGNIHQTIYGSDYGDLAQKSLDKHTRSERIAQKYLVSNIMRVIEKHETKARYISMLFRGKSFTKLEKKLYCHSNITVNLCNEKTQMNVTCNRGDDEFNTDNTAAVRLLPHKSFIH